MRGLKEFIVSTPPQFKISNKCCKGAKKDNINKYLNEYDAELSIVGIRKSEGGIRAVAYKTCFDIAAEGETWDKYRPIFWFTDNDKLEYEQTFDITHSDCYCKYGLPRTGCAGCPFAKEFETELKIIEEYEPTLYIAVNNIFGQSYDYTRKYLEFRKTINETNGIVFKQQTIFDI